MVVYVNAARRRRLSRESAIPKHDARSERSDPGEELAPGSTIPARWGCELH